MQKLLPGLPLLLQFRKFLAESHGCIDVLLIERFPIQQRLDQALEIGVFLIRRVGGANLEIGPSVYRFISRVERAGTYVIEVCSVDVAVVSSERRVDYVVADGEGIYDGD